MSFVGRARAGATLPAVLLVALLCGPLTALAADTGTAGLLRALAASAAERAGTARAPVYGFRVVESFPHDPEAFTQGLVHRNGRLYEGTGLKGRSSVREVRLRDGTVLRSRGLPRHLFGEGITVLGDRLFQLTWQAGRALVFERDSFRQVDVFRYAGEGWGLTDDGNRLIMSDGSDRLRFLSPETFEETGAVAVRDAGRPVHRLNELEHVSGLVLANVWRSERIAAIDPGTGQVAAWIDLKGLLAHAGTPRNVDVLNGIAYDASEDRLLVTGKFWPRLFHVRLVPPAGRPGRQTAP